VLSEGGNRFEPADLTVFVGDTVNWVWPAGSAGHNVVPGDGESPTAVGAALRLSDYPKFHSFRFQSPGVSHYHCMAHGGTGGIGMSGTIPVVARPEGPQ
jgi:plastocyanin